MKRFLHKIIATGLTFAVLFATTSFNVDMHYCCDKLVDVAVFGKATSCGQIIQKPEEPTKKCSIGYTDDCCSNESFIHQGDNNLKTVSFELNAENFVFLHTFFYTYINHFEGLESKVVHFLPYDPPFIEKDVLVLYETFLI
ncbi:hypothetical protein [uncultured Maribacter sp.]|uniref:HYC_CC_PP family protein n=1 Tax=uncultured Maribacter sp. TaxID=431308 RepID=UPI0030D6DFBD|tara:strand:- start:692 stop:1114 length:423 start_codon:yes stop_codon:yes gene_type:complete